MMTSASIQRASNELQILEADFAAEFVGLIEARLRRLTDVEINALYLKTHTGYFMGDDVDVWTAVLMPVIEKELDLRHDVELIPHIGPVIAPDLYKKGGGHYVPF